MESRRVAANRVVQRPLLYLGEINDSQAAAWRKTMAGGGGHREVDPNAEMAATE